MEMLKEKKLPVYCPTRRFYVVKIEFIACSSQNYQPSARQNLTWDFSVGVSVSGTSRCNVDKVYMRSESDASNIDYLRSPSNEKLEQVASRQHFKT